MKMRRSSSKGRRGLRVASVVREVVSKALVTELNDPRLAFVTVTGVELSADLRFADVRVSVLAGPKEQKGCMRAIQHAHGRIQNEVAEALAVKFCPILRFHPDSYVKRSVEISALIRQARAEDEAARADRIRRGVESPDAAPQVPEESPPVMRGAEDESDEDQEEDDEFEDDEEDGEEDGDEDEEEEDEEEEDEDGPADEDEDLEEDEDY